MTNEQPPAMTTLLFVSLLLGAALLPLNSTMIGIAQGPLGQVFHATPATLQRALVASYLLVNIVLQSPAGKISDRIGPQRALRYGNLIFLAGTILGMFAPQLWVLAISRGLMAMGGALVYPSTMTVLRTRVPVEKHGRMFGMFGAGIGLSAAIGPVLGGLLLRIFSWRSLFAVNLVFIGSSLLLRSQESLGTHTLPKQRPFDTLGSLLLGASLVLLVLAADINQTHRLVLLTASVVLAIAFTWWERKAQDPVIDFALFRHQAFTGSVLVTALNNLVMYALLFELPLVFSRLDPNAPVHRGSLVGAMTFTMMAVAPFGGRWFDAVGAKRPVVIGLFLAIAGLVTLAIVPLNSAAEVIPSLILIGIGLGLSGSPTQAVGLSAIAPHQAGIASGVSSTVRYIGGIAGTSLLAMVMSPASNRATIVYEHRTLIQLFCVCMVICLLIAISLLPNKKNKPPINQ